MSNSAAVPVVVEDVQGDDRWMSMVGDTHISIIDNIIDRCLKNASASSFYIGLTNHRR